MSHKIARTAVVAMAAAAAIGVTSTPAAAAAMEWSTAYGTASASGTSQWTYAGPLMKTVWVYGTLSNTGPDCHVLQLVVNQDLAALPVDVAQQCGPGSTPISTSRTSLATPTVSYGVRICRVVSGAVTGCGSLVRV